MKKQYIYFYFLLFIALFYHCTQPLVVENITFEEHIVVKARLTNEMKQHSIVLSKTIPLDSTDVAPLKNAKVSISDDNGIIYDFIETENGRYSSNIAFLAEPEKLYTLHIETSDGRKYNSTAEQLPALAALENLNFDIESNDSGNQELVIKVNSTLNTTTNGGYYRYTYDETYKVKAVYWSPRELKLISENPYRFAKVDKDPNIHGIGFCYGNQKATSIMVTETQSLSEDRVVAFPIRTIPLDNYIIGIRYSILVQQYVLNKRTYDYYELLSKFSDPDNIFSQVQLGNVPSNITSESNPSNNKVSGFFEVSSVSSERYYINREDITNTDYVNYIDPSSCQDRPNPFIEDLAGNSPLLNLLENGYIFFSDVAVNPIPSTHPYLLIGKACGDCTNIGPPLAPSFWTE